MMKSITPVISVILLVMMTIAASAAAFFFINSNVIELESQGSADSFPGMDNSRINLVSVTGSKAIVRNDGTNPVTDLVVFINGELLNYTLSEPILPGEVKEINYNPRQTGQDLQVKVIYNQGKTDEATSPASINTPNSGFSASPYPLNQILPKNPEDFEDYAINTDLADVENWLNNATQDELCNATIQEVGDKVAYFHDLINTPYVGVEKIYNLSILSSGSGNNTINLTLYFGNEGDGDRVFALMFYDGADNIIQILLLANGLSAVLRSAAPPEVLHFFSETGGGGEEVRWDNIITYEGLHDWTFIFNEDDETIRYFIDDAEIYADDGLGGTFDDYYESAGPIAKLIFTTIAPSIITYLGTPYEELAPGFNTTLYIDELYFDWI